MKHKDEIIAYLDCYSSRSNPKSIPEIAETLSIDEETIGLIIHELLKSKLVGVEKSPDKYNFLYYKLV